MADNVNHEPTDAQKSAGNYKKRHDFIGGMRISIENEAGSKRRGVGKDGKAWESDVPFDYGYVRGSKGLDKDHLDITLGPKAREKDAKVHVIDQNDPETGELDEHKVMLGFDSDIAAHKAYHSAYPTGWRGFGGMVELSVPEFKKWAYKGKTRGKRKAAADYVAHGEKAAKFAAGGSVGFGDIVTPKVEHGYGAAHDYNKGGLVLKGAEAAIEGAKKLIDLWHGGAAIPTNELRGNAAGVLFTSPDKKLAGGYARDAAASKGAGETHLLRLGSDAKFADEDAVYKAAKMFSDPDHYENTLGIPGMFFDTNWTDPGVANKIRAHLEGQGFIGARGADLPPDGSSEKAMAEAYMLFPAALERAKKGYAEGGLASSEDEDFTRPAFRTPMVARRREDRQDREGAKEVPLQALRGLATGTLGFGGDIEKTAREVLNLLADGKGKRLDETPVLPTGDFYRDVLPLKPTSAAGRAASDLGSMAAVPASVAATGLVRATTAGAKGALPVLRGAERMAENARNTETLGGRRMGSPQQRQTGAVKVPGGNWFDPKVEAFGKNVRGWDAESVDGMEAASPVADWMEKRSKDYLKNKFGTVGDPLLKLESEGRLPVAIEHSARDRIPDWALQQHYELTGRHEMTPLEALAARDLDVMNNETARTLYEGSNRAVPEWLKSAPPDEGRIWNTKSNDRIADYLGLHHMRDYLEQAVGHNETLNFHGGPEGVQRRLAEARPDGPLAESLRGALNFQNAGLTIDPDKLPKMSFADIAGKTGDWNKAMERWREEAAAALDMNKGIKSVLKTYPDNGYQWVELSPEGLANEGTAMGHCVGGYCSSVESGQKRILSLRDQKGRPHVTVELAKPQTSFNRYDLQDALSPEQWKAYNDQIRTNLNLSDEMHAKALFGDQLASLIPEKPWDIRQIKGKANEKPIDEYIPAVQDLVRNMGPWGDIRDLNNSGLRASRDIFNDAELAKMKELGYGDIGQYLTPQEATELQRKGGWKNMSYDPQTWRIIDPGEGYASGGSVKGDCGCNTCATCTGHDKPGYAVGGSIGAGNTVGLATFNQGQNNNAAPRSGVQMGGNPVVAGAGQAPAPQQGSQFNGSIPGILQGMGLQGDPSLLSQVPTWNVNDPNAAAQIKAYTSGANAGTDLRGISAFMRGWSPTTWTGQGGDVDTRREEVNPDAQSTLSQFAQLAGMDPWSVAGTNFNDANSVKNLAGQIDSKLQDYRFISGLQPNQQGGNGLKTYETIYRQGADGQLNPIWSRQWARPEDHGWARGESGGSFLKAMSMMLPAVGGWAGLAGQAAGTTGATVANVAGNAALGAIQGGARGALTSLAGQAGGAAGGAGANYFNVDPSVGSYLGSKFATEAVKRNT